MTAPRQIAFALCIFWGVYASAQAQSKPGESRGKLLYETYCNACHTSQIHWRKQKLATDWGSLKAQVQRWQANLGLLWSAGEITDVAYYLNTVYYGFPVTDLKGYFQEKKPIHILRQY